MSTEKKTRGSGLKRRSNFARSPTRLLVWGALVLISVGILDPVFGRTFLDAPPTQGLYKPTAYTLARGETQIQFFAFTSPTNPLEFFEFEYGLTDAFQLGMRPVSALFGDVRVWGKYHVGTTGPISLAIPFGVDVLIPVPSWALRGGWVLSWRVLSFLTLHPGLDLSFTPAMGVHPYLGVDLDAWWNLKLVAELDGEEPYVHVGILIWAFGFVRLQVDTPLPIISLRITVTGRF
ncbi:MAG: hypothetical protein AB1543_02130 [Candidatus Bipolaricaulota bacterium]